MRCPECGHALDVRDFALNGDDNRGAAHRYERNSAIGGLVACGLLGFPLFCVLVMLGLMPLAGFPIRPTIYLVVMAVVMAAWFVVVLGSAGGNLRSWYRSWRKSGRL
jgi:hypothetical protein